MKAVRARRIATVGAVAFTLIAGVLIAASGTAIATTASSAATCSVTHDDSWPMWVQGRPAGLAPRTVAGVYLWHDDTGWHIRVTHHTGALRTFAGNLTTQGLFVGVRPAWLETNDTFSVSPDRHTLTFTFKNHGGIDGLDFFTRCAPSITFGFQAGGATGSATRIIIGRDRSHPSNDPFVISRSTTTTSTSTSTSTTTLPS